MSSKENELREKWNAINYYSGGALKLSVNHPLEWYVRYASPEHKSVVIVSQKAIKKIESSKCIDASCNQRKDGKYAISFTLMDRKQEDVFIIMAGDIIEYSNVDTDDIALLKVLRRYNAWLKLLDHKCDAVLGSNTQKGLIGELLFLKEKIETGMLPSEALIGWDGPEGADQDFVYAECWYEIKSTGASSTEIFISSVEQLDRDDEGELVVYRIDKCAPDQPKSFTLYGLVHAIIDLISRLGENPDELVLKLGSAGYIDMKEYDKQHFSMSSKQIYSVNNTFPKIRRKEIPNEIINMEYRIDIPSIKSWEK
ncbi:PD-(D/E)XK motif protein [Holdemania filiformis]|uniref:PD-(D/E)XK motif protein n=1 Tax=Holdemania filiformis TaxID=61171 RepID=UPI002674A549|nr:PD-(D/E)XK motif protein [Holdemania filiformis]